MTDEVTCGTESGMRAHRQAGEDLCALCEIASSRRLHSSGAHIRVKRNNERWDDKDLAYLRAHLNENPLIIAMALDRSALSVHQAGQKHVPDWPWKVTAKKSDSGDRWSFRRKSFRPGGSERIGLHAME